MRLNCVKPNSSDLKSAPPVEFRKGLGVVVAPGKTTACDRSDTLRVLPRERHLRNRSSQSLADTCNRDPNLRLAEPVVLVFCAPVLHHPSSRRRNSSGPEKYRIAEDEKFIISTYFERICKRQFKTRRDSV